MSARDITIPFALVGALAGAALFAQPSRARETLDIYFIDTEGGQSTLYVAPSGQTMLVDTGNAGDRDRDRILGVLAEAGVTRLDHLFLTHYHGDHYGSLLDLAGRLPVGRLYDHGPSAEGDRPPIAAFEQAYGELARRVPRTVVKPGDPIPMDGLDVSVVASDNRALTSALPGAPGAGSSNPVCATVVPTREEAPVDDNHNSAGFVMRYGRFRTINLGDLT